MHYEKEQFERQCNELRDRFLQESNPQFYLRSEYSKGTDIVLFAMMSRIDCEIGIPADGFAAFSKNLWESVYENAQVLSSDNLEAGQDELAAAYKCEEATSDILRDIAKETVS